MINTSKNRLRYLLNRCLNAEETIEERAELDGYFRNEQSLDLLDKELLDSFYQPKDLVDISADKQEEMIGTIYDLGQIGAPIRKMNYWKWAGVAAVLMLVILPFVTKRSTFNPQQFGFTDSVHNTEIEKEFIPGIKPLIDIQPADQVATLEMADGTTLELENLAVGETFEREGVAMERSADGSLVMRFLSDVKGYQKFANHVHTIKTPRGGTYKVVLSDGTMVYLNADSKLSFPTSFNPAERRVTFEGEAYFDVAKDKTRQFVVASGSGNKKQEILVFGTEFNLTAYPEEGNVRTTLIEGSVKVKADYAGGEVFLKPNEESMLNGDGLTKGAADLEARLAWKNNLFYFADEPIENVMSQISRWYDVDVVYHGPVPEDKFWGQMSRDKKLSELLEILTKMNDLKFDILGKEVHIMQ